TTTGSKLRRTIKLWFRVELFFGPVAIGDRSEPEHALGGEIGRKNTKASPEGGFANVTGLVSQPAHCGLFA
ncbi:MAG: hypothetical protein WBB41_04210, partial [Candidatus Nanopelagicales bacterium]